MNTAPGNVGCGYVNMGMTSNYIRYAQASLREFESTYV